MVTIDWSEATRKHEAFQRSDWLRPLPYPVWVARRQSAMRGLGSVVTGLAGVAQKRTSIQTAQVDQLSPFSALVDLGSLWTDPGPKALLALRRVLLACLAEDARDLGRMLAFVLFEHDGRCRCVSLVDLAQALDCRFDVGQRRALLDHPPITES